VFGRGRSPAFRCPTARRRGHDLTDLCREFGISRKTRYKIFDRYKEHGLAALSDRSARGLRANQLPGQVDSLIVSLKRNKPHWGARKIRELLRRPTPAAKSTMHAVLDRHRLVKRMGKRRARATGTPLSKAWRPTICGAPTSRAIQARHGRYCYPLSVGSLHRKHLPRYGGGDRTKEGRQLRGTRR
jgi:transposase